MSDSGAVKTIRDARAWARVTSVYGTPRRPRSDSDGHWLWCGPSAPQRIDIMRPPRTRLVLVCPKSQPIAWWLESEGLPADLAMFVSRTPSDPRGLSLLESLAGRAPVAFIGDLDPPALVQFVETQRMAASRVRVVYAGIDDSWLDRVEACLPGSWRLERLLIALDADERALLPKLERAIDLERLVGPRSAALLRGGRKLEIEGATNPRLYGRDHFRRLIQLIRSAVRTRRRAT
jgi:hypothetical protein